jgi:hypothetical protein
MQRRLNNQCFSGHDRARKLLDAPAEDTLKGVRDAPSLPPALSRHPPRKLCGLRIRYLQSGHGLHLRIKGDAAQVCNPFMLRIFPKMGLREDRKVRNLESPQGAAEKLRMAPISTFGTVR